jgi:iron complex outermembrane receptor protein
MTTRKVAVFSLSLLSISLPIASRATDAAASPISVATTQQSEAQAHDSTPLEEVIVTATKRDETLREVPESIAVVSAAQIEGAHIQSYADLSGAVPGLSYTNLGGPGLSELEIRGISSTIGQSTVAIYVDDSPIANRNFGLGQPEPQLFDLAQVEVLRGPQGTLYGASAMGGIIKLVSNPVDPNHFAANVYQDLSGTENGGLNYTSRGVVNIPIAEDTLGLRLAFQSQGDSGYVDHLNADGDVDRRGVNSDRSNVGKMTLLYTPTSGLSIKLSEFAQWTHIDDTSHVDLATPNYYTNKLVAEPGDDTLSVANLSIGYDFGWAELTSSTSYTYRRFARVTDATYYNSAYLGYLADSSGLLGLDGKLDGDEIGNLPAPEDNVMHISQPTEEIRLASKNYNPQSGNPFTWLVGAYVSDSTFHFNSSQYIPGLNETFQSIYGISAEQFYGNAFPNDFFFSIDTRMNDQQTAFFGELSDHITPRLTVTVGAREFLGLTTETDYLAGYVAAEPYNHGSLRANALTPKFSVSYDFGASTTAYAKAEEGFRMGGINFPVPAGPCAADLSSFGLSSAPREYQSDKLWNFEVGTKGSYLNGATSLNASVYDIEWSRVLQDVLLPTCGFEFYGNLGHARSRGTEIELLQKVMRGLTVRLTGQFDDARFTEPVPGLGISSGDLVPGTPDVMFNLSPRYERAFTDKFSGFAQANWQYIGTSHGTFIQSSEDYRRPSYSLVGASLGLRSASCEISIFAKNVLDDRKIIQRPFDNDVAQGYTPVPRIIGMAANVSF